MLLAWNAALLTSAVRGGRALSVEIVLRKQHYLQACIQGSLLVAVVPRWWLRLAGRMDSHDVTLIPSSADAVWQDTSVELPDGVTTRFLKDVLAGMFPSGPLRLMKTLLRALRGFTLVLLFVLTFGTLRGQEISSPSSNAPHWVRQ